MTKNYNKSANKKYKVVLLCTCWIDIGVRTISAVLKKNGIETELYFIGSAENSYSIKELMAIISAVRKSNPDLIGISSIILVKKKTMQLIGAIKRDNLLNKKKIVWGGMQATAEPDFCLRYIDAVGIGECDLSFLELVNKYKKNEPYLNTPNFIFNYKEKRIVNELRPLIGDLDRLPFEDYQIESHKFLKNSSIISLKDRPEDYLFLLNSGVTSSYPERYFEGVLRRPDDSHEGRGRLYTCLARGCPLGCTYCMNNYFKKIYPNWGKIRYRSSRNSIKSLKKVVDKFKPSYLYLLEDDFFLRPIENIKEFSRLYGKLIKRPFAVQGTPWSFSEEKLKILIKGGLDLAIIGIQSGSERINREIYHRYLSDNDQILKVAKIINKYKHKLSPPWYDFIIDNPYESEKDMLATIKLIGKLPFPFFAKPHNLIFFPKTELYESAKRDGLLKNNRLNIAFQNFEKRKKYWEKNFYLNILLSNISGICADTHLGKIEREKLKKLTNRAFIKAIGKRKKELLSKNFDLNSLV